MNRDEAIERIFAFQGNFRTTLNRMMKWDEQKTIAENAFILGTTDGPSYQFARTYHLPYKRIYKTSAKEKAT